MKCFIKHFVFIELRKREVGGGGKDQAGEHAVIALQHSNCPKAAGEAMGEHMRAPQIRGATWRGWLLSRLANFMRARALTWNEPSRGVRRAPTSEA